MLCLALLLGCGTTPTREQVLRALVQTQLVPSSRALSREMAALVASLRALEQQPAQAALLEARSVWRRALLAWERVYALRTGPIVDNSGLLRARFWPVRAAALEALLAGESAPTPARVDELGVDLRGMYALEWLLFGPGSQNMARSDAAYAAGTRAWAIAFASNAQQYADDALRTLADGSAVAEQLSAAPQESASRLVNQMVATVETLASDRLAPVLEMHAHGALQRAEVQGAPSGSSRELVLAQLRATERLYTGEGGAGLAALVAPVAAEIDHHVRARFAKAIAALTRVDGPLEDVVVRDRARVEDAFRSLKEVELVLKVDLASALGVTMTFTGADGD